MVVAMSTPTTDADTVRSVPLQGALNSIGPSM
jgi:hypothetical protein